MNAFDENHRFACFNNDLNMCMLSRLDQIKESVDTKRTLEGTDPAQSIRELNELQNKKRKQYEDIRIHVFDVMKIKDSHQPIGKVSNLFESLTADYVRNLSDNRSSMTENYDRMPHESVDTIYNITGIMSLKIPVLKITLCDWSAGDITRIYMNPEWFLERLVVSDNSDQLMKNSHAMFILSSCLNVDEEELTRNIIVKQHELRGAVKLQRYNI